MIAEFIFPLSIVISLRLLYTVTNFAVRTANSKWDDTKRRQFVVRIVSLTHATVSGISTLYGFYRHPKLWSDPYLYECQYGRFVLLFSMGYFIHDCIDMLANGEGQKYKEYIVHHMLSIFAVISILLTNRLLGFAVICLLVEVQTVFLHVRTILRIIGLNRKNSLLYRIVMHCNFGGLILFRHIPTLYLLTYICFTEKRAHGVLRVLLACALTFLTYHNFHLQLRFMKMDGYIGDPTDDDDQIVDPLDEGPKNDKTKEHHS